MTGWLAEGGRGAFLKVMVLPSTFRVEPSAIRLPTVAELVVRLAVTVAVPAPTEEVRPRALRKSALPLTLRSAPVDVSRTSLPAPETVDSVWPVLVASVATPALMEAVLTPLARSMAFSTSVTLAVEWVELAPM